MGKFDAIRSNAAAAFADLDGDAQAPDLTKTPKLKKTPDLNKPPDLVPLGKTPDATGKNAQNLAAETVRMPTFPKMPTLSKMPELAEQEKFDYEAIAQKLPDSFEGVARNIGNISLGRTIAKSRMQLAGTRAVLSAAGKPIDRTNANAPIEPAEFKMHGKDTTAVSPVLTQSEKVALVKAILG